MKDPYTIVKGLIRTEKATTLGMLNKYFFWVDKHANKIEIKKSVEEIYKVKVTGINTLMVRGKAKKFWTFLWITCIAQLDFNKTGR